ncbi:MAG: DUF4433 domain-containing protein [Xanthomonadales bacterium]|nr:DUF4433 domain-containing protein [Xanthomonadales bacterium]
MTAIYHITHIDNLSALVGRGALLSDTRIREQGLTPQNIAYGNIKARRAATAVTLPPRGVISDYVPFYFCPRSPMLYAVHRDQVPGYEGGQTNVVHLVADAERLVAAGLNCLHTEGHAAVQPIAFHRGCEGFPLLDWPLIRSASWANTVEDGDRKRRKQAEFLVHGSVPWTAISQIGVIDATIASQVSTLLASAAHCPDVVVQPQWYYT